MQSLKFVEVNFHSMLVFVCNGYSWVCRFSVSERNLTLLQFVFVENVNSLGGFHSSFCMMLTIALTVHIKTFISAFKFCKDAF